MEYNHRVQANGLTIKKNLWKIAIKKAYKKDELIKVLLKKPSANENVRIKNGFILMEDAIYIPS